MSSWELVWTDWPAKPCWAGSWSELINQLNYVELGDGLNWSPSCQLYQNLAWAVFTSRVIKLFVPVATPASWLIVNSRGYCWGYFRARAGSEGVPSGRCVKSVVSTEWRLISWATAHWAPLWSGSLEWGRGVGSEGWGGEGRGLIDLHEGTHVS